MIQFSFNTLANYAHFDSFYRAYMQTDYKIQYKNDQHVADKAVS